MHHSPLPPCSTQSRTGGLDYVQRTCFTQADTKLNSGIVFFANNGMVNVSVSANGEHPCERSAWADAIEASVVNGVTRQCDDDKVSWDLSRARLHRLL